MPRSAIFQRRSHEAEVRQWTQEQAVPTVAVITPRAGASTQRLVLPGTVQAWFEAPIYARVNGYLKKLFEGRLVPFWKSPTRAREVRFVSRPVPLRRENRRRAEGSPDS